MVANGLLWQADSPMPIAGIEYENWYALHTRPRHEKIVAQRLAERNVETFLPTVKETHRWSDRKKTVELPLFSCYVFARFISNRSERLRVLRVGGVLGLVGSRGEGAPVPDDEIESVRTVIAGSLPWSSHPFLKVGQRVRIRSGALNGLEGVLVSRSGVETLVISIDAIQRSLAVKVEGYQVEPI